MREAEVIGGADQLVGGRDLDHQGHGVEMPVDEETNNGDGQACPPRANALLEQVRVQIWGACIPPPPPPILALVCVLSQDMFLSVLW